MTKAQAKQMRVKAATARRTQEPPTQQDREFVDYYTHPAQRTGLGYAAQRGPSFWAEEVERVVAAYQKGLTPLETEAERGPSIAKAEGRRSRSPTSTRSNAGAARHQSGPCLSRRA